MKDQEKIDEGVALYVKTYGNEPSVTPLAGAGSDRLYRRMHSDDGPTVVATTGNDVAENACFIGLAKAFRESGCNVPEIIAVSSDGKDYLQEDLGDTALLPLLSTPARKELSAKALRSLARLQTVDESVWMPHVVSKPFSQRLVMWDLNYFKYEFLKPSGIAFDEEALEDDFQRLASDVTEIDPRLWGFMYRDCQSRNVMVRDGEPWWIDFQGGRKGPLIYDAVSFLWQAKAGFSPEERKELLNIYAEELAGLRDVTAAEVLGDVGRIALLRTLQVLGAYGFRGLVEKKAHFIESIPGALRNLHQLKESGELESYPEISKFAEAAMSSRFMAEPSGDGLTVKVFSFSYKKGYPEDLSGNGGGFMFDCRGMHNPGRYDQYKPLTGLDREVIDFLEERGEVQDFVETSFSLVRPTIARYLQRGFRSLQVGFGCTGGRHRSVYCAQHFAEMASKVFPDARIELVHREQGLARVYNEKKI